MYKRQEERGNRIFPLSDRSLDVLQAFENEMKKNNVKIYTETEVKEIKTKDNACLLYTSFLCF